jgi:hypothetical protein
MFNPELNAAHNEGKIMNNKPTGASKALLDSIFGVEKTPKELAEAAAAKKTAVDLAWEADQATARAQRSAEQSARATRIAESQAAEKAAKLAVSAAMWAACEKANAANNRLREDGLAIPYGRTYVQGSYIYADKGDCQKEMRELAEAIYAGTLNDPELIADELANKFGLLEG